MSLEFVHSAQFPYIAGLVGAGALMVGAAVQALLSRRSLKRRLTSLALRLAEQPANVGGGLEALLAQVERAADRTVESVGEADAAVSRLAGVLDALPQAVVVCDEQGRAVFRNVPAAILLAGARNADALLARAVTDMLAAASEGRAEDRTLELYGPPRRTVVLRGALVDDGHRPVGAMVVAEDVTERRLVEAAGRRLVAHAAEELHRPVAALAALAGALAADDAGPATPVVARRLQAEAEAAERVVSRVVDLARADIEQNPEREAVSLRHLVAEAVGRSAPEAAERSVAVTVGELDPELHAVGDRRQLTTAVAALVENAVRWSEPGGGVWVSVDHIGAQVDIVVRDEGRGIPSRDLPHIFDRFHRVERGGPDGTAGPGLGLPLVRRVVANHGGSVVVDSREGSGSTFVVRLPLPSEYWRSPETGPASEVAGTAGPHELAAEGFAVDTVADADAHAGDDAGDDGDGEEHRRPGDDTDPGPGGRLPNGEEARV